MFRSDMRAVVAVLPGRWIGPEVVAQATEVLAAVAKKWGHVFVVREALIGGCAIDQTGSAIPLETLELCRGADAVLLGVDQFGGGSASHSVVAQAAMAVSMGVADYVVCWRAINARSEYRMGGHRSSASRRRRVSVPDALRLRHAAAAVRRHGSGLHGPLRRAP